MVENSLAFALYLPHEIDAFSFSGPEQFSSGLRSFALYLPDKIDAFLFSGPDQFSSGLALIFFSIQNLIRRTPTVFHFACPPIHAAPPPPLLPSLSTSSHPSSLSSFFFSLLSFLFPLTASLGTSLNAR